MDLYIIQHFKIMNIIVENWILKPRSKNVAINTYNETTGRMESRADIRDVSDNVLVVGTKDQISKFFDKMFWNYGWQIRGSYKYELKDWYIKKYEENNNEVIVINLF
tara:strand:+ start:1671 stop:1991 length:321 start_codon:yes stop_codon:yes gene_type:complete